MEVNQYFVAKGMKQVLAKIRPKYYHAHKQRLLWDLDGHICLPPLEAWLHGAIVPIDMPDQSS